MRRLALALCALILPVASSVAAQSDFGELTAKEMAAFGAELRALLLEEPQIVAAAMAPRNYAAEAMQDAADADLALIGALAEQVLEDADIALFVSADCVPCEKAITELQDVSDTSSATFKLHDMSDPDAAALAAKLGMTEAPFYVLPNMILRGHMPSIVLTKYLTR